MLDLNGTENVEIPVNLSELENNNFEKVCTNDKDSDKIKIEQFRYNKYLNSIVLLKNTIVIVAFVMLAIVFNKWWISLFAALFLSSIKEEN